MPRELKIKQRQHCMTPREQKLVLPINLPCRELSHPRRRRIRPRTAEQQPMLGTRH
jgi:hypothetical protein